MDNMLGFPDFILIDEKLNEKHKMVCNRHFYYKNSLTTRGPGQGPTETNLLTLSNNVYLMFYAKEVGLGT